MRLFAQQPRRSGFTLVELLMVISILTLLSSTILFALWGAQNDAKEGRTRAVIKKIDALMQQRCAEFQVRALAQANRPEAAPPWPRGGWARFAKQCGWNCPIVVRTFPIRPWSSASVRRLVSYRFQSPGDLTARHG